MGFSAATQFVARTWLVGTTLVVTAAIQVRAGSVNWCQQRLKPAIVERHD